MIELFNKYKNLLEERLDKLPLLNIGEDSIRYDFFAALMETYSFRPSQIRLEVAIHQNCFVPVKDIKALRKEKPMVDLVVKEPELHISVEFGLFRQNSNKDGTINKTARTVKMLNDMIRVALEKHFTGTRGLFICVADHKMLGHQLSSKILGRFPSDYLITNDIIERQLKKKTNQFDRRFLKVFQPMNSQIRSELIYNRLLKAKQINNPTYLLIWDVGIEPGLKMETKLLPTG